MNFKIFFFKINAFPFSDKYFKYVILRALIISRLNKQCKTHFEMSRLRDSVYLTLSISGKSFFVYITVWKLYCKVLNVYFKSQKGFGIIYVILFML